ncbi:MAG: hypothetical protein ACI9GW_003744 [Halieaceae bacterium]|jgi:hypothetical protein
MPEPLCLVCPVLASDTAVGQSLAEDSSLVLEVSSGRKSVPILVGFKQTDKKFTVRYMSEMGVKGTYGGGIKKLHIYLTHFIPPPVIFWLLACITNSFISFVN